MMSKATINQIIKNLLHKICSGRDGINGAPGCAGSRKRLLFLASASFLCFLAAIFSVLYIKYSEETLSSRISPQVLRFHVLANSDSDADQALKLRVKQMLIEVMYEDLEAEGAFSSVPLSKETMTDYVASHEEELEKKAEDFMAQEGFSYTADLRLERCYFPTKIYGDVVFPCGTYDAVRVLLGEGAGKNWWCVLYPPLCFTDNAYAVVPDSSKEELKNLLPESDFRDLMKNRRIVFGDGHMAPAGTEKPSGRTSGRTSADTSGHKETQATVRVRSRLLDLITKH